MTVTRFPYRVVYLIALEVIRDALEGDDYEWARGKAWALQQALGATWYYEETNPHHACDGDDDPAKAARIRGVEIARLRDDHGLLA